MDDAVELFDDVTSRILTGLNVKLVAGEQARVWHKALPDLRSLEEFYRGGFDFFNIVDQSSLVNARGHFEAVEQMHPESTIGPTWIALTHWYQFQRVWTESRSDSKQLAKERAEKGPALPDSDGQAMTVLCHMYILDGEFDEALKIGQRNLEVRPTCLHSNAFFGNTLHYCGEHERALHHLDLAFRYAPMHPPIYKIFLASACRTTGDFETAKKAINAVIAGNPNDVTGRIILTSIAVKQNQPEESKNWCGRFADRSRIFQ